MPRRKAGPLTEQRVDEALAAERKQSPCVKCGDNLHIYHNKAGKHSCPKEDNNLRGEQRERWTQHDLNPRNEAAVIEARLAAANAPVEGTGLPQVQSQTLPVLTVPGVQARLRQWQSFSSAGPVSRGLASSERVEEKEQYLQEKHSSGGSVTPATPGGGHQGKTFVPSRGLASSERVEEKEQYLPKKFSSGGSITPATPGWGHQGKTFVSSNDIVVGKSDGKGKGIEKPARPKALLVPADYAERKPSGTVGLKIKTVVNFFRIDKLPKRVFKYTIDLPKMGGRDTNRHAKRLLIEELMDEAPYLQSNSTHVATDFNSLIFSTVDLFSAGGQQGIVGRVEPTTLRAQPGSTRPPITINVEYNGSIACRDILQRYVTNQARDFDYADIVTALNVFTCKYLSRPQSDVTVFRGSKFFINVPEHQQENRNIHLSPGLHLRRGFFASVRPGMDSTFLNVNVAASAFFNELNLARFMAAHFKLKHHHSRLTDSQTRIFGRLVRGLRVRLTYNPQTKEQLQDGSGKKKTVAGIGETADLQMFYHDALGDISVQKYFNDRKQISVCVWYCY